MTRRDISIEELQKSLKDASKSALSEAKENQVNITYLKDGVIYQESPDGTVTTLKELDEKQRVSIDKVVSNL